MRRSAPPPSLPDVVSRLVEPLALGSGAPLRRIGLAWAEICGSPLWRHLEPQALEGSTLHVGARGVIWRDAVFQRRAMLVERIRRYVPAVTRIWLHTLPEAIATPIGTAPKVALSARTAGISDPELRAAMEQLLAARRGGSPPER